MDFLVNLAEASKLIRHDCNWARALVLFKAANLGASWWLPVPECNDQAEFYLFGEMRSDTGLLDTLKRCEGKRIVLHIDAPGGDADVALEIGEWLSARGASLGIVENRCHSAALEILLGCERRIARPGATFLVHALRSAVCGPSDELRAAADRLDAMRDRCAAYLSRRTGASVPFVLQWLGDEMTLDAHSALNLGIIHDIEPEGGAEGEHVSASIDLPSPPAASTASDLVAELVSALGKLASSLSLYDRVCLADQLEPLLHGWGLTPASGPVAGPAPAEMRSFDRTEA